MPISPELCRAGRALLAWSQRDLAERAQTAVSTIADFERGARSPIANSVKALEAALKDGGVLFEGGRAVLAGGIGGFTQLSHGRPIPLITSADLTGWAERLDSQAGLPTLISMLIRASAGPDAFLRFPTDEGVRDPGWDGTCESPRSADFVPAGSSRWELSVNKSPQAKALSDFIKRATEGDAVTRASTTYVAVAMRAWNSKEKWAAERRESGPFKDVRTLDVHNLVDWLAMHVQVAFWLAVRLGKRSVSGVSSIDEAWRRWALATTPPLTERVILAGRDREATDVHAWLKAAPSVLHVQAAETEEASAFLWAAIQQLPEAYRETYRTHAVVAESDSAVREISVTMKPKIIVMSGASPGFAESIARAGHHVYAVHGPEAQMQDAVSLGDVRRVDLAYALESMGQTSEDARALAGRAGGSIATLRRILSETTTLPGWFNTSSRNIVNAAFFAGAWDESAPEDQTIIAALAKRPFDDVSGELASLTAGIGAPLRRSITRVQVVSVQDLWSVIAPRLNDADIVMYLDIARAVLSKVDARFYEADHARLIAFGDRPQLATKALRRGILETLNVMAAFHERAKSNVPLLEERVRGFVRELLNDADTARWWSLRDFLPLLAEAAPEEFLEAVETSVKRDDAPITILLQSQGEGLFARDYVSDLTTALERLAWLPEYFADAATALAALADKDAKVSRHGNRPAGTLRQIFLLWSPQTLASPDARLTALGRIREQYPIVAWHLMLSLLPKYGGDAVSLSSKPAWRRSPTDDSPMVGPSTRAKDADIIFEWLLEDAGRDVSRWNDLLESLTGLYDDQAAQRRATEGVLILSQKLDRDHDRLAVRDSVRKVLHRHREFTTTAGWAMPESVLEPLQKAFDLLSPANIVDRERWVFAIQPAPPDSVPGHDLQKMEAHNNAHRHRVAREIIACNDVDKIFAMAIAVENPFQFGIALVGVDMGETLRDRLIGCGAQSSEQNFRQFARGIVYAGVPKYGTAWGASIVGAGIAASWAAAALVTILQGMPQDADTFNIAREAGVEVERLYWETTPWMWFIHSAPPAIALAVEAKLLVGRSIEAVELIGQTGPTAFPPELLLRSLEYAGVQLHAEPDEINSMVSHYCGLILDRLIADEGVDRDALIRLEWTYFGVFQEAGRDAALLEDGLARDPQFFVNVVSSVYRPDRGDSAEDNEEDSAQMAAVTDQSYALLNKWAVVPGSNADGSIDADTLSGWVRSVRDLAISAKRVDPIDRQIGRILSAAKAEPNGDWPPKPVREILERLRNKQLEIGFQMGARDRRGVTTRGPLDGGELERDLKSHYEALARRFRSSSPRTATVLKAIAADYKLDALYMDQLADAVDRA